jgi:2-amino-4-hydroxy-6-hydroxymethyldihydropteridine diphosphokinase
MHRAAIALGSNLDSPWGDSAATLRAACDRIGAHPAIALLQCSAFYRTSPLGPPQPDYVNACVVVQTRLGAIALLDELLAIEQVFGRKRLTHWGPRTLDLDLLLYDTEIVDHPRLQVPHPGMSDRSFVLIPLAEIAPEWIHPLTQMSILKLRQALPDAWEDCAEI